MAHEELSFESLIKTLRAQQSWTLRAAAKKIGVNFSYLAQLETGVAGKPSEELARKIARAYKTDEEQLVFLARKLGKVLDEISEKYPNMTKRHLKAGA